MADLPQTKPVPPTSPPAVPIAPDKPKFLNVPAPLVVATRTPEEIAEDTAAEKAAQEQDMIDAKAEEVESNTAMAALEGAFIPMGITRHRGVGPLIYETKHGLLKVFSGDLICHLQGPTNPTAPEAEWILEDDYIVVSEAVLTALLFTVEPRLFPELLEYRAQRIGEERRAAAAPPPENPVALSGKEKVVPKQPPTEPAPKSSQK